MYTGRWHHLIYNTWHCISSHYSALVW